MNRDTLLVLVCCDTYGVSRRVTWRHEQPPPKFEQKTLEGAWVACEPDPELVETARTLMNQEWR